MIFCPLNQGSQVFHRAQHDIGIPADGTVSNKTAAWFRQSPAVETTLWEPKGCPYCTARSHTLTPSSSAEPPFLPNHLLQFACHQPPDSCCAIPFPLAVSLASSSDSLL